MTINKEWASPCGLYCGVCGIRMAYRDNNEKFKERLSTVYNLPPDQIRCKGCLSDDVFEYCKVCPVKSCVSAKGFEGCHDCSDFPCDVIKNFPMPVGRKVILRAVPFRREHGTDKWMEDEEKRYVCPKCGQQIFRGAKRCNQCKEPLDID